MTETTAPKGFRTHCVGRYLIDLPETADIRFFTVDYDWMRVSVKPATRSSYLGEAKTLEDRLRATPHKKDPSLLRLVDRDRDENSIVFVHWEKSFSSHTSKVEGFVWNNGTQLSVSGEVSQDKANVGLTDAKRALADFRPRAPDEIPTEPGFCIDGGYFVGVPEANQEEASIRLTLKDHPDVWIDITTDTIGKEQVVDAGLLARVDKGMSVPLPLDILNELAKVRTLRRGQHPVGPVRAEELLEAMPNKTGRYAHQFRWEAFGERAQTLAPSIVVEFGSGKNKTGDEDSGQPSLTDEQAIALFDAIVNSIRLRPTAPAKTSANEPPPTPLGGLAATGRICPQTGWWECADEGRIAGSRRQFFRAGEVLPKVTQEGEPSFMQRLKGEVPTHRAATVWKLVDYNESGLTAEAPTDASRA